MTSSDVNGGNYQPKIKSIECINNICSMNDLCDIWRIRNLNSKRFTWRSQTPFRQRRLDYYLISNHLLVYTDEADILPGIATDHSAITLSFNSYTTEGHGPSY